MSTVRVDCAVHPVATSDELRGYMKPPYDLRSLPGPRRHLYQVPGGEFDPRSGPPGYVYKESAKFELQSEPSAGTPYGDPNYVARWLFSDTKLDFAILTPLTRGVLPDADHGTAVCNATNQWLADRWLTVAGGRFRASIRVNPMDPTGAVDEIERRAGDARFVQVAVPTQALHPYGQRHFFPIWKAAAEAGLPLHLHADTATGVEYWPTPVGYPSFFAEMSAYQPGNSFIHLESFITEGVFERLPNLRIICGDGGLELLTPLFWRFDKSWRGLRIETPGAVATPSQYMKDRVRFVWHQWEGSSSTTEQADWLSMAGGSDLLLYGSNFPYWDLFPVVEAAARAEELSIDTRVLGQNAVDFWVGRLVGGVA